MLFLAVNFKRSFNQFSSFFVNCSSFEFGIRGWRRIKLTLEVLIGNLGVAACAAGKEICRSIAEFRPCMNCQMRFCNDYNTADTVRIEHMELCIHYGSPALHCGIAHHFFNHINIVQNIRITSPEFGKDVPTQPLRCNRFFFFNCSVQFFSFYLIKLLTDAILLTLTMLLTWYYNYHGKFSLSIHAINLDLL